MGKKRTEERRQGELHRLIKMENVGKGKERKGGRVRGKKRRRGEKRGRGRKEGRK